jgi:hypothetical protein
MVDASANPIERMGCPYSHRDRFMVFQKKNKYKVLRT